MVDSFKVWLRPLGNSCRVRVEGAANTDWLLGRLSRSFVFKTIETCRSVEGSTFRTFRIAYDRSLTRPALEAVLGAIPSVRLMTGPE